MQMANQTEVQVNNEHKRPEDLMAKDEDVRVRWISSSCLFFCSVSPALFLLSITS
jgi:hypothetical protein